MDDFPTHVGVNRKIARGEVASRDAGNCPYRFGYNTWLRAEVAGGALAGLTDVSRRLDRIAA